MKKMFIIKALLLIALLCAPFLSFFYLFSNKINIDIDRKSKTPIEIIIVFNENVDENIVELDIIECALHSKSNYISKMAPYAFIEYENYKDFKQDIKLIKKVIKLDYVLNVSIGGTIDFCDCSTINTTGSNEIISFDDFKSIVGVDNNTQYTGNGIKVGLIEGYTPNDLSFINTSNINIVGTPNSSPNQRHSVQTCSIIGGYHGIAQDSILYVCGVLDNLGSLISTNVQNLEYMISSGVKLVNISMGFEHLVDTGILNNYSAYIDYLSSTNDVVFVCSAGNYISSDMGDKYLSNPSIGMNTISVGSIDKSRNLSYFSCYKFVDNNNKNMLMKPTIVAPGENILFDFSINEVTNIISSGTSYSAPIVTGVIALLMEEFPGLDSTTYISAICSGADKINGQVDDVDESCGSGLINYNKAREVLLNEQYYCNSFDNALFDYSGDLYTEQLYLGIGEHFKQSTVIKAVPSYAYPSFQQSYFPDFRRVKSTCYNGINLVVNNSTRNTIINSYYNNSNAYRFYDISLEINDLRNVDYGEVFTTSYSIHHHSLCCEYLNLSQHKYTCSSCGYIYNDYHVLVKTGFKRYECLDCGYVTNIGIVPPIIIEGALLSSNGSVLLQDGIIYLTNEDINDYKNGTLVFYRLGGLIIWKNYQ